MPRGARVLFAGIALPIALSAGVAFAQAAPPAAHQDAAFDVMNLLAHHGLHDIDDESWNAYGQLTLIGSYKAPFHAPYTNLNQLPASDPGMPHGMSLTPDAEGGFTSSFTLFFGLRLWKGGEAYLVPEVIAERPLSQLRGIGGAIQNFELQKNGSETPQIYRSRTYLRQTIGLGGERSAQESNPMQLATTVDARRLVFTAGNFTILDVFDHNSVSWDPRQTFFNMAFMTYASWDFPSDARGYSWGATGELFWDDWSVRYGRITPPLEPNVLQIDFRFWEYYGDQVELEHDHTLLGQPGAVRLLGYHDHVDTGAFADAIAAWSNDKTRMNAAACAAAGLYHYDSTSSGAPDLCFVRHGNDKYGIGLSIEQHVTPDVGIFARAMYS
ncbi:MAG: carbohydrate porin, partial [Polyangiaceae bacterium]